MSRKTSPARIAAFLRALAETGNQTLACEAAKISRAWLQLHRSTDPAFDAAVRAAVAAARAALSAAPDRARSSKAPPRWGQRHGEELVVRGTNGRRVQVARARLRQWTPRVEARFLGLLAQSCNARLALRAVGLSAASLYAHRRRWPDFDARCAAAIGAGYRFLDGALTASVLRLLDPAIAADTGVPPPEPAAIAPIAFADAIRLVRLREKQAREAARRRGGRPEAGPRLPGRRDRPGRP